MDEKTAFYRQQIALARPDLTIETINVNWEGMINDVLIVNGRTVFRFPKAEWAVEDLRREAACLELARQHVEMPLPDWTVYEGERGERSFVSYEMIPGEPLQRYTILRLSQQEQEALAEQLGTFLYQLHTIPLTHVQTSDIKPSYTNRQPEDWQKLYADVQEELFPYLMQVSRDWVHQHFSSFATNPAWMACEYCFMNGDLASYHLLYNPETRRLNGIIDFGTAGLGDPAADFGCLIDQYGESFVQRIARYYPPGIESLINRARFWAGTLELQWALGGLRHPEDPSWFFVHIGRARDVGQMG